MDFLPNTHRQLQQLQELLDKTTDFNGPMKKKKTSTESIRSAAARESRDPDPRWTWQTHDRLVSGDGADKCASANLASHLPWSYQPVFIGSILVNLLRFTPFFRVVWVVFHVGQARKKPLGTTAQPMCQGCILSPAPICRQSAWVLQRHHPLFRCPAKQLGMSTD